jgi:multicomponent Na+:H+ antiporter subunit F
MMEAWPFLTRLCLWGAMGLLLAAFALAAARAIQGPTSIDRIVALDLFATMAVAAIAIFVAQGGRAVFLDAALSLALVTFFSTLVYARFMEMKSCRRTAAHGAMDGGNDAA